MPLNFMFNFLDCIICSGRTVYVPQKRAAFFFASFNLTTQKYCHAIAGVALKIQQMFIIVPFIRFFFSAEPLPLP